MAVMLVVQKPVLLVMSEKSYQVGRGGMEVMVYWGLPYVYERA